MICLVKSTVDGVECQLLVDETLDDNCFGGQPVFVVGEMTDDFGGFWESVVVEGLDTLTMVKAIESTNTLKEFEDYVKGTWKGEKCVKLLEKMRKLNNED